jgi:hypothetical protein
MDPFDFACGLFYCLSFLLLSQQMTIYLEQNAMAGRLLMRFLSK